MVRMRTHGAKDMIEDAGRINGGAGQWVASFATVRPGGNFRPSKCEPGIAAKWSQHGGANWKVCVERSARMKLAASKLARKAAVAKQGNSSEIGLYVPALPHEPNVKVEDSGGAGKYRHCLAFNGNGVCLDLVVEWLAESHGIAPFIRADRDFLNPGD
jgi:hypothetical protein